MFSDGDDKNNDRGWGERIIDIHDSFMSMYHSIVIDLNGISYKKEDEKTESTETAQSD